MRSPASRWACAPRRSPAPVAGVARLAEALPASAVGIVSGTGATSLALALLAGGTTGQAYAAAIGLPHLGLEAAGELGVTLEHLVLCPTPGRAWPEATALALEACALVLLAPPTACTEAVARRLAARVRERRSLLLLLAGPAGSPWSWPGVRDVVLEAAAVHWTGLCEGPGRLETRELLVTVSGHRARHYDTVPLLLPGRSGHAEPVEVPVPARIGDPGRLAGHRAVAQAG